jgi:hypothetical protein
VDLNVGGWARLGRDKAQPGDSHMQQAFINMMNRKRFNHLVAYVKVTLHFTAL